MIRGITGLAMLAGSVALGNMDTHRLAFAIHANAVAMITDRITWEEGELRAERLWANARALGVEEQIRSIFARGTDRVLTRSIRRLEREMRDDP